MTPFPRILVFVSHNRSNHHKPSYLLSLFAARPTFLNLRTNIYNSVTKRMLTILISHSFLLYILYMTPQPLTSNIPLVCMLFIIISLLRFYVFLSILSDTYFLSLFDIHIFLHYLCAQSFFGLFKQSCPTCTALAGISPRCCQWSCMVFH